MFNALNLAGKKKTFPMSDKVLSAFKKSYPSSKAVVSSLKRK
jgi:hypothetical protein